MKLKLVFCLGFILLFSVNSSTQNYISYHKKVNEAKILLSETKFASALEIYKTVFVNYPKRFYRDLHNACVCAIYCDKMEDALHLAKDLILHGYQLEDFKTATFKKFRTTEQWKEIEREYAKLRQEYESHLDQYLYKKYSYMFSYDQKITGMKDLEEHNNAVYEFTSLLKIDYEINGIPNFVRFKDKLNSRYLVFYRHFFGKRGKCLIYAEKRNDFKYIKKIDSLGISDLLHKEVRKGNLSPGFVISAESYFKNEYGINSEIEIRIDLENEKLSFILSQEKTYDCIPPHPYVDFSTIDQNRNLLGVLPLKEECNLFLAGTWYTEYPFQKIKDAVGKLENKDLETVKKKIKQIEAEARKNYSNALQTDFFLTDYHAYKHTKYIGLEKYVINTK